jgi:hypothetical protein
MRMLQLLVCLLALLVTIGAWVYAMYCGLMTWCHRRPGLPHYSLIPQREELTLRGERYRSRHWRAWCVGCVALLIGAALAPK